MFEHRSQRPLSRHEFARRLARQLMYASLLLGGSVVGGMAGYHWIAGASWIDSVLNASMLLGGMGPVGDIPTSSGKLFAGFFALYAGLVFLAVAALLLGPMFHRALHVFHFESSDTERG